MVGKVRIALGQFLRNALHGAIQAEPRFHTGDQQIHHVRKALSILIFQLGELLVQHEGGRDETDHSKSA